MFNNIQITQNLPRESQAGADMQKIKKKMKPRENNNKCSWLSRVKCKEWKHLQWKTKRINIKACLYRWARTQPVLTQWLLTNLSFQKLRKAAIRFVMSVCPSVCLYGTTRLPLNDFHESWSWLFFENISRKFEFHWNLTRITGTLHDKQYTFFIISRSILVSVLKW